MALGEVLKEFGVKLSLGFDKSKVEQAQKNIQALGSQMKTLGISIGAASASLLGLATITSSNGRALQQNAQILGLNVERLQELEYAAKVTAGVGRGELMGALEGVSATLDKARHSDVMAAQSLIRLGVPMSLIANKAVTADQVMLALADRFKSIHDPIAKARLATDAFGGAGANLIPLLNKGSAGIAAMGLEARKMGVILSKDAIDKGAEFDRQFTKIWFVIKSISFTIGNQLIKYLTPMVMQFERFIVVNRKFIALGIAAVMKSIGHYLQIVFGVAKFVADRFVYLTHVLGGVERVSRVVAVTLALITGAKIISGVGMLISSWRAVSLLFAGLNIEFIAVAAAIMGIVLVIQDLTSSDSIIKEWLSNFEKAHPIIMKIVDAMSALASTSKALAPESTSKGFLSGITSGVGSIFHGPSPFGAGMFGMAAHPAASAAVTPSLATPGATGGATQHNHITVTAHVTVPPGTAPGKASHIVAAGIKDGMAGVLRHSRNQALGGRAY